MFNFNNFNLERYPYKNNKLLAISAAEEYLSFFMSALEFDSNSKILILNDNFGTLSLLFNKFDVTTVSDSYLSSEAIEYLFKKNNLINNNKFIPITEFLKANYENYFDIALIRIPKATEYFLFLTKLASFYTKKDSLIFSAGMTKYTPNNARKILLNAIGNTDIGPVKKKAIGFKSINQKFNFLKPELNFKITESGKLKIVSAENVFSDGKPDPGTLFLLNNLPNCISGKVADLGCGSGLISSFIKFNNPQVELYGIDDSYIAIESSKKTFEKNNLIGNFIVEDGLNSFDDNFFHLVVSNPPFHSENVMCPEAAERHFPIVSKKLNCVGKFILVGNLGVNYKPSLINYFKNVEVINKNKSYYIFECDNI